jgi:hypothetical protein
MVELLDGDADAGEHVGLIRSGSRAHDMHSDDAGGGIAHDDRHTRERGAAAELRTNRCLLVILLVVAAYVVYNRSSAGHAVDSVDNHLVGVAPSHTNPAVVVDVAPRADTGAKIADTDVASSDIDVALPPLRVYPPPRRFRLAISNTTLVDVPSPHWASGEGLTQAISDEPAEFFVHTAFLAPPRAIDRTDMLYAWIFGPAMLAVPLERVANRPGVYRGEYRLRETGSYLLSISLVSSHEGAKPWDTRLQHAHVRGSPFRLHVQASSSPSSPSSSVPPPPPMVSPDVCTGSTLHAGRWLRCVDMQRESGYNGACLRDGWLWVPWTCHYRMYRLADLRRLRTPRRVLLLGTSVLRGHWWHLWDSVFNRGDDVSTATMDALWKCWGRLRLQLGSFRLDYQDFRAYSCANLVDCDRTPRATFAQEPHFLRHMKQAYASYFPSETQDGSKRDDTYDFVLHEIMTFSRLRERFDYSTLDDVYLPLWRRYVRDRAWNGTFAFSVVKPSTNFANLPRKVRAEQRRLIHRQSDEIARAAATTTTTTLPSTSHVFRVLDDVTMPHAMLGELDAALDDRPSIHHHHRCGSRDVDDDDAVSHLLDNDGFRRLGNGAARLPRRSVCSSAQEMSLQLLLNEVFEYKPLVLRAGSTGKSSAGSSGANVGDSRICHQCPASIIPVSINPAPVLQCETVEPLE